VFHGAGGGHAETKVQSKVQDRSGEACQEARSVRGAGGRDLDVHENVLRKWIKEFGSDPAQAFPGRGQMKPGQLEIERLGREVNKLKAERDILKRTKPSLRRKRHGVRLHCEAPEYLAGGMAMQCDGRVPVGLPCLAESNPQRQIPKRRSRQPAGEGKLPCQRANYGRPVRSKRAPSPLRQIVRAPRGSKKRFACDRWIS